jgi:hypothetical protein
MSGKRKAARLESAAEDDEEDDEDYDPANDPVAAAEDETDANAALYAPAVDGTSSHLSYIQKESVDRAFESLFGYKWGTSFELQEPTTRNEKLLVRILGAKTAAYVLRSQSIRVVQGVKKQRVEATSNMLPTTATHYQTSSRISSPSKVTIAEEQTGGTVIPTENNNSLKPTGVDQLLQSLAKTNKTTTVAKTSHDWENFKDQTGLADKLESKAESKDSYLKKQEFLSRVDQRKFELERKERDGERSKRGK